jgi:hypothetical protein
VVEGTTCWIHDLTPEHLMQICQVERESARKRKANQRLEVEWGDDDVA